MDLLNKKLENDVKKGIFPGINYGIVGDEEITGSIGFKQIIPFKEETTIDTLYDVASLTKVLVTVPLICKMSTNNMLSIYDSVKTYLPNFKYGDITIYHLLTHTSGLPADLVDEKITTRKELLKKVYSADRVCGINEHVIYSDLGYILLGEIIEKVYNKPLNIVAKEEIFIPLEMSDTTYNPSNKENCAPTEVTDDRGLIQGIVHDKKACSMGGTSGHAGVFSTVNDLMHFIKMILNDGMYNNQQFLPKQVIDSWFRSIVYDDKSKWTRSFCWITGANNIVIEEGENIISFSGFTGPSISIDRDKKLGIALLTNRVHPSIDNQKLTVERPLISKEIYKTLHVNNFTKICQSYKIVDK